MPGMSPSDIDAYLQEEFPQVFVDARVSVAEAEAGRARLHLTPGRAHLRPGNTVSGPAIMMMADAAAYAALLSLDSGAKMAVTSDLTIHFLRAAAPGAMLVQTANVIKAGRRISVIACETIDEQGRLLAHATTGYAMPAA
ncbi:MAG: PaaI family thioesterase [Pseudomonadota bacterium]